MNNIKAIFLLFISVFYFGLFSESVYCQQEIQEDIQDSVVYLKQEPNKGFCLELSLLSGAFVKPYNIGNNLSIGYSLALGPISIFKIKSKVNYPDVMTEWFSGSFFVDYSIIKRIDVETCIKSGFITLDDKQENYEVTYSFYGAAFAISYNFKYFKIGTKLNFCKINKIDIFETTFSTYKNDFIFYNIPLFIRIAL